MTRAVLSFGSNVGDSLGYLRSVVDDLQQQLVAVSSVYQTAPWGGVEQDPFLNAVAVFADDGATPQDWLERCHRLETAAERHREVRWGPRTLDVDVVDVTDAAGASVVQQDIALTLPHPRAHERAFVLVPWLEIEPDAVLAGFGRIAELVGSVGDQVIVRRTDVSLQ